jgi:tol-pal system protein YbgF
MKKRFICALALVVMTLNSTSCLKTRGQIREDSDDREVSKPIPVQAATEVQPQGQYVLDEIKAEFTRLEGKVEDLEREQKNASGKATSSEDLKRLDARLTQLEQNVASIQESMKKLQESSSLADPGELFKKAQSQFNDGDYEAAAETWGLYLKAPKATKLEDATFMRGESYYKLKQYKKAIVEYSKFPEKYTRSKKMPEALYKIGQSFEALGMKEDAKGFYQELVEKFPKSPEAKRIRKKVK